MKLNTRIRFIIEYFSVLFLSVQLYLFIDGNTGILITLALLLVPIYSMLTVFVSRKPFNVTIELAEPALNKDDILEATINIGRQSSAAPPFLCLDVVTDRKLVSSRETLVIPMAVKSRASAEVKYKAIYCGGSEIRVENVTASGLFGILRVKTGTADAVARFAIFPKKKTISASNPLLYEINTAGSFNDSEETTENKALTAGIPGYEHREYHEGDSLRRVNWKLSAKRDNLYVRLDEAIAKGRIHLVLSPYSAERENYNSILCEALPAIAERLNELENRCIFHYYGTDGAPAEISVETPDDIEKLRTILSEYRFTSTGEVIPDGAAFTEKSTAMTVIFTPAYGEREEFSTLQCEKSGCKTIVVTAEKIAAERAVWVVGYEDTEITAELM